MDVSMRNRLAAAFGWGVVATLAMTAVMLLGQATGLSPMPEPVPKVLVSKVLGVSEPMVLSMGIALGLHLVYGGLWAAVLARVWAPVTLERGLVLGGVLWLVMQLIVLPLIGWGVFGAGITVGIAVATLVLHAVYGAMVGWLVDRRPVEQHARASPGAAG